MSVCMSVCYCCWCYTCQLMNLSDVNVHVGVLLLLVLYMSADESV